MLYYIHICILFKNCKIIKI